jgi:hypothetical protein
MVPDQSVSRLHAEPLSRPGERQDIRGHPASSLGGREERTDIVQPAEQQRSVYPGPSAIRHFFSAGFGQTAGRCLAGAAKAGADNVKSRRHLRAAASPGSKIDCL